MELNDVDRAEIARLIQEGNTSGIMDAETLDDDNKVKANYRISWELKADKFEN